MARGQVSDDQYLQFKERTRLSLLQDVANLLGLSTNKAAACMKRMRKEEGDNLTLFCSEVSCQQEFKGPKAHWVRSGHMQNHWEWDSANRKSVRKASKGLPAIAPASSQEELTTPIRTEILQLEERLLLTQQEKAALQNRLALLQQELNEVEGKEGVLLQVKQRLEGILLDIGQLYGGEQGPGA